MALRHPDEYPFSEGRLVSTRGLDIDIREFEQHFEEQHVPHSNALHSVQKGAGAYFVGPQARFALNFDRLTDTCRQLADSVGLEPGCTNPFKSIVVRAIEMVYACEEAIRIIDQYAPPERPFVDGEPMMAIGYGCTEAPRGILYHRYCLDARGDILEARIVPPTSQNQKQIEDDLKGFVPRHIHEPDERLTWLCEQAVRNYDPCISCATHFLKIEVDRRT